jgi:hypothetical protein
VRAIRLDTEGCLAPVAALGVVPVVSCQSIVLIIASDAAWSHARSSGCRLLRRVVPDGVAGPQANPLGNGAVLLLRFGKLLLGAE